MAKRTKNKKQASPMPEINTDVQSSLGFNEYDPVNYGKFVPWVVDYGRALQSSSERVNEYDRRNAIAQSRNYEANLPEIDVAFQRLADFTVGNALIPIYNGANKDWASQLKQNFLNKILNRLTNLGVAADWQTMWQLVLKLVLRDGDLLMIPYTDRYGLPNVDFIESESIRSRDASKVVKTGRFAGYPCNDGVIYDTSGNVIGYQIYAENAADDYTISVSNCFLIYSPFSFSKGRGRPVLHAGTRHGRNLMDYQHYIPQIVKAEAQVQLIETNQEGKAPVGRTAYSAARTSTSPVNPNAPTPAVVTEYTQGGIRYIKTATGKLEALNSNRPHNEVQAYITGTQKELLLPLFPHQLLLSPETIGGPGSRGMKEVLVAAINTHRNMIEKYALILLQYVVSVAMNNPKLRDTFDIQTNFKEDFTNWSFTRAPEPCLDPGYERAADITDKQNGLISDQAIMAKEGKLLADVNREIDEAARAKAVLIESFIKDHPSLEAYAPQMYGLKPQPNIQMQADTTQTQTTKGKK